MGEDVGFLVEQRQRHLPVSIPQGTGDRLANAQPSPHQDRAERQVQYLLPRLGVVLPPEPGDRCSPTPQVENQGMHLSDLPSLTLSSPGHSAALGWPCGGSHSVGL